MLRLMPQVLILDEISMVSGEMFEALERITSDVRGHGNGPFGGLQLVLCGDYFQCALFLKPCQPPGDSDRLHITASCGSL